MTTDDPPSAASSSSGDTWVPSDADIKKAIQELAEAQDLQGISSKKFLRMVSRKLGVGVDDLASKKSFCKQCLDEELAKQEDEEDSMPTEQEIQAAAQKLASKVDIESTSFKKFTRVLCDDLDVGDLTPAKPIIRKAYDEAVAKAEQEPKASPKFPSDEKIVNSCKKLAASSKIDLEDISKTKFLRILQKRMGGIDLSSKKELVYATLRECKAAQYGVAAAGNESLRLSEITATKPGIDDSIMTASVTATTLTDDFPAPPVPFVNRETDEENPNQEPESFPDKPRSSAECKQGWRIKEAREPKDVEWVDDYFDDDVDDLVAVFDHDYKTLFRYFIKVAILTNLVPVAIFMWTLIIIFYRVAAVNKRNADGCVPFSSYVYTYYDDCDAYETAARAWRIIGTIFLVIELLHMSVGAYGWYRIVKSQIYAMHVAVLRDGVRLVMDDHLRGRPILAGLHIFDTCLLVSRQEEMIPFDQIVNFRIKAGGEVPRELCFCCFWICGCCLRIPFEYLEMKTSCDTPQFAEGTMWGLFEPKRLDKLVWGMKRDKGEQILRDANSQREEQARRAEEQRAMDSDRRAQESQSMLQMMSMMVQQNQQMASGNGGGGSPATSPMSASASSPQSFSPPPPPPPTR